MVSFIDAQADLIDEVGEFAVVRQQAITKDFLDELHSERMAKAHLRYGEHNRVAAVPTMLVDLWLNQGVPFYDLTAREIVQRLERDNLHAFITTDKPV